MQQATAATDVKEQVVDRIPKRIKELKFGIPSVQDVLNQSVMEVCDRNIYTHQAEKAPATNGPLDPRMGLSTKNGFCETCGESLQHCNGHFGVIKLVLPAFHVGYFGMIVKILQSICKECGRILLSESQRRDFLRKLRMPDLDNLRRTNICKSINAECKKTKRCYVCGAHNGLVKKAGPHPLKVVHDRFSVYKRSHAMKKVPPVEKILFERSLKQSKKSFYGEVDRHIHKALDDLNPLRVLNLFKKISASDCELLGMNPSEGRPEMFIWQYFPVSPVCIRPSVQNDTSTTEDDLTTKLSDIVQTNNSLRDGLEKGFPIQTIMERWEFMQTIIGVYVNSDNPGLQPPGQYQPIRGICQRLKGKQGRFRGNLSGKRVDFSGRTVISPDPNLGIDQVAIPIQVAKRMTYPETVSRYNLVKLQSRVRNGVERWPGANYVWKKNQDIKQYLKYGNPSMHANNLKIGDVVERHLEDGDIVLFNRQPSLHKLSILSHYVKVRPNRTFSLNECVCTPYNADFDGDEMNLHVPQTEEARIEAIELMGVKYNLATPKNGEPIISAIQDFITAAYLMSSKDVFYDRKTFANICMSMVDGDIQVDLPPPTVLKPTMLWTGKQIFNVMMRPSKASPVLVNLDAAGRQYRALPGQPHDLDKNDSWLCIRNSEVMCGVMDKSTIGSGKKDSVFYVILRDFGPDAAVQAMNRLAKLAARWLTNQGFSIGISDVSPGGKLIEKKMELVEEAYERCDTLIKDFKEGKLAKATGCDEEQTLENDISGILSKVRQQAGDHCISELSKWNSPLIMATSGSKGSNINVSQMVAVVGQQIIGGKRVADGFQDRSLPHFPKNARQPPSKGFVRNSFFSGLHPTEFLFHAISGREGLVDTAVKTAETGYMSRRLMKSLEDLSVQYDDTVRNGSSSIIQFQYGADKLDPVDMEGKAKPVNFERTYTHSEATTWSNKDRPLLPHEIKTLYSQVLSEERTKLLRRSPNGDVLDNKVTNYALDNFDSFSDFLDTIEDFLTHKASALATFRKKLGLPEGLSKSEKNNYRGSRVTVARDVIDRTAKISKNTLEVFLHACLHKFKKAQTEPGHAVGAVAAQSIGEPGTQMTLKTFHFAGVAGMSITQGVPRIKEIINATPNISTPIISCELVDRYDVRAARIVKGRIEMTFLKDVVHWIEDIWSPEGSYLAVKIDLEVIERLQLDITMGDIRDAIVKHRRLKLKKENVQRWREYLRVDIATVGKWKERRLRPKEETEIFLRMQHIKRILPRVPLRGHPGASRAIIKTDEQERRNTLLVEGYGLRACMNTEGVKGTATRTNSVMEVRSVLGIEAARKTIIDEIGVVMGDMDIDPRHMQLLADVMTFKGDVLGITRFGLSKMRDSVLQLASFEKTPDHLFEAALHMKTDRIEGVSECIIMGQSMSVGTGAFKVARRLNIEEGRIGRKATILEDSWNEGKGRRGDEWG